MNNVIITQSNMVELNEEELRKYSGGIGWGVVVGSAALAYTMGKDLGEEVYHWFWD